MSSHGTMCSVFLGKRGGKLVRLSGDGTTSLDNVKIEEITQINE